MDEYSYHLAWVVYLFGATGCAAVFWRMTRSIKLRRTKRSLRALVVVLLYTPINTYVDGELWLIPAYLVGAYDWVLGDVDNAVRAGMYISSAYCLLILLVLLESVLRRLFGIQTAGNTAS